MDVAVWLRSHGLSRYEAAFSDNSIYADILPDLTDGDLAESASIWGIASACSRRSQVRARYKPAAQPTTSTGNLLLYGLYPQGRRCASGP